jgi:hypothetical protein
MRHRAVAARRQFTAALRRLDVAIQVFDDGRGLPRADPGKRAPFDNVQRLQTCTVTAAASTSAPDPAGGEIRVRRRKAGAVGSVANAAP